MLCALLGLTATGGWAAVEIQNADFAAGVNGQLPEGWTGDEAAAGVLAFFDADGHSGKSCLRYHAQEDGEQAFLTQAVTLEPETEYVLSAWLKSDGTTRPAVDVRQPGERNSVARVASEGSATWQKSSVRFNSGPVTEAEALLFGDLGPGRTSRAGQAWIDDVRIAQAGEEPLEGPIPGGFVGPPPGENLALGKGYTWLDKPTYSYATDDGDITQLTDGEHSVGYFWVQKSTVGWQLRRPLSITIDLEQAAPICGVSFNTAGGTAGVGWPAMIFILTSTDGESFDYVGELISLSGEHGLPDPQRYVIHRYVTDRLKAAGRYVKLVICPAAAFLFCDEIEVYRGEFSLAEAEPGQPVENDEALIAQHRLQGIVGVRLTYDIQELRRILARAELKPAENDPLAERLDALLEEVVSAEFESVDFWRGLPYNELHERIYAVNAAIRRAQEMPETAIWQKSRWDMLDPMEPPEGEGASVSVPMMNGEYRSAAFNVTNYSDRPALARISVEMADGTAADFVTVQEVQYVQTQERQVVANALPVADKDEEGRAEIRVPAGMTGQVWLTLHPEDLAPGQHRGTIKVEMGPGSFEVSLTVEVAPMQFPRPPLAVFCWDYVGDTISYAPNVTDLEAVAENLRSHYVDAPWAHPGNIPWPEEGAIDEAGHLTTPLDFGPLDRWIDRFQQARLYCMFTSMTGGHRLRSGLKLGTERWRTAMGEWITAIVEHVWENGVEAERLALLLVDEPHSEKSEQLIVDCARALKAAQPAVRIFEDPVRPDPTQALAEMYEVCDILCPNLPRLMLGGEKAIEFYHSLQEREKRLFIYQCSGPHKLLDPYTYHRLHPWHAWRVRATGVGFWGYIDAQKTGSSWDNFKCGGTSYSLVYADDTHLADSKQWDALREGVQDYTYLAMLTDELAKRGGVEDSAAVRQARELLERVPDEVAGEWNPGAFKWAADRDRSGADEAREEVLHALIALAK